MYWNFKEFPHDHYFYFNLSWKVFTRFGNSSITDYHQLPVPVSAKFIAFHPTSQHIWNCLRVEIYSTNSTAGRNIFLKKQLVCTHSVIMMFSAIWLVKFWVSSCRKFLRPLFIEIEKNNRSITFARIDLNGIR